MNNTDLLAVLTEMRSGQVISDVNAKFNEVLKAVIETGGKGELNIKLKISPSKFAMGGAVVEVETEHDIKLKKPELKIGRSVFFVTKDGTLTRRDPNQDEFFDETSVEEKSNGRRSE